MKDFTSPPCPECDGLDRRDFVRAAVLGGAAIATGLPLVAPRLLRAGERAPMPRVVNPAAEDLVKELYATLDADQKKAVVKPWDHPARKTVNPNKALDKNIGSVYDAKQQELIERVLKALSSGDEAAWKQITRGGTWDNSKAFTNTGANIFGDPSKDKQFAFLFTGHHLTLRCDSDLSDGVAFGGPIYYGHTPSPYSDKNVFYYQTQQAMKFYDALNNDQRKSATITMGNPGEGAQSVKLPGTPKGVAYSALSGDQKELMEQVLKTILSPFRKEEANEVAAVVKQTGGMDKLQFAFFGEGYEGAETNNKQPWSFWRIEGPGLVWNFRVLPHVHTFVNIKKA